MVDIVEIKSAVRSGEITVYEEAGNLYIENTAGERIELKPKGGENNDIRRKDSAAAEVSG